MLFAEHRGAAFIISTRRMGLARVFMGSPSPLVDADDGLAGTNIDMLNADVLFAKS